MYIYCKKSSSTFISNPPPPSLTCEFHDIYRPLHIILTLIHRFALYPTALKMTLTFGPNIALNRRGEIQIWIEQNVDEQNDFYLAAVSNLQSNFDFIRADWHSSVSDSQTHLTGDVFIVSIRLPFYCAVNLKFTNLIVSTEQSTTKYCPCLPDWSGCDVPFGDRLVPMIGSRGILPVGRLCQSVCFSFRRPFDSSSEGHRNSV